MTSSGDPILPQWHETTSGVFERPFDAFERSYAFITTTDPASGKQNLVLDSTVKVNIPREELIKASCQAWTTIRYMQPGLAMLADYEHKKFIYHTVSPEEIQEWLDETLLVEEQLSPAELYSTLRGISRANLCIFPHRQELLFRCPHISIDGGTMLRFWDEFFMLLANPQHVTFGDETHNLPLGAMATSKLSTSPGESRHFSRAEQVLGIFFADSASIGLTPQSSHIPAPGQPDQYTMTIPAAQTADIISAVNDFELTVANTVHAAIMLATQQLDRRGGRKYQSQKFINMHNPSIDTVQEQRAPVLHRGHAVTISPADSLVPLSHDVEQFYLSAEDTDELDAQEEYLIRLKEATLRVPASVAPCEPMFSSLGIIDQTLKSSYNGAAGHVEVEDFCFAMETLMANIHVYFYTFQDQMRITFCWNKGWSMEENLVSSFMVLVMETLMEGLGLDKTKKYT